MNQKSTLNKTFLIACFSVFFLIGSLTFTDAEAASVTLTWNANNPTPEGYRVFARRAGQAYNYSRPAWQGTVSTCTINNLQEQTRYYFVVRAYQGHLESADSNQVRYIPHLPVNNNDPDTTTPSTSSVNSNTSDFTAPYWDGATLGIGSVAAASSGGSVIVEFDRARDGVDGRNLRYHVYYAPSASWDNHDWSGNSVIADAAVRAGNIFAHAVTVNGLTNGVRYTFGVRAEDQSGNEETNTSTLRATPAAAASNTTGDTIIDNRDSQTSKTGSWGLSGGADPYGQDSFFSRDGATFTWHFSPLKSGLYEVAMWWTVSASRSNRVPVRITHADGLETVSIDQRLNGGQWNSQGRFYFEAGGKYVVSIVAPPGPSSTCADAVRFQLIAAK